MTVRTIKISLLLMVVFMAKASGDWLGRLVLRQLAHWWNTSINLTDNNNVLMVKNNHGEN
jgi:hypothetical protein